MRDSTSLILQSRDLNKDGQLLALGFSDGLHCRGISVISKTFLMFGPSGTKLVFGHWVSQDFYFPLMGYL